MASKRTERSVIPSYTDGERWYCTGHQVCDGHERGNDVTTGCQCCKEETR